MREVNVEQLKSGDLITVVWSDAWEDRGKLPIKPEDYDYLWVEFGVIYLYTQGRIKKHLILAYNKPPGDIREWTYTAIPTDLVVQVYLLAPKYLEKVLPGVLQKLLRKVKVRVPKRLNPLKHLTGSVKIK